MKPLYVILVPRFFDGQNAPAYSTKTFEAFEALLHAADNDAIRLFDSPQRPIFTAYAFSVQNQSAAGDLAASALKLFKGAKTVTLWHLGNRSILSDTDALMMALGEP